MAETLHVVVCSAGQWCSTPLHEANAAEHARMFDAAVPECAPHRTELWTRGAAEAARARAAATAVAAP